MRSQTAVLGALMGAAVTAVYLNHFHNAFHFDDFHTIVNNPAIRDWRNIPHFFVNPLLFSIKPEACTWRPLVSASLALDYRIGGLHPCYFRLSTFFWFLVQLVVMFLLFRHLMDRSLPARSNVWTAFLAAVVYGV